MGLLRVSRIKKFVFAALLILILIKYAAMPIFKALKRYVLEMSENRLWLWSRTKA